VQDKPARPAARRIRRTLYCDGESPAAAVTALDRSAASHAARTSAISTSSSSESRIAIAAAGVGTDMGDNYSSRGVLSRARDKRKTASLSALRWDDVDFQNGTIRWRAETDKTGHEQIVPMTDPVKDALAAARGRRARSATRPFLERRRTRRSRAVGICLIHGSGGRTRLQSYRVSGG